MCLMQTVNLETDQMVLDRKTSPTSTTKVDHLRCLGRGGIGLKNRMSFVYSLESKVEGRHLLLTTRHIDCEVEKLPTDF